MSTPVLPEIIVTASTISKRRPRETMPRFRDGNRIHGADPALYRSAGLEKRSHGRPLSLPPCPTVVAGAFSVWTECTVPTGKRSEHPRGMSLATRMLASSGAGAEPMLTSSSVIFCRKRATYPAHCRSRVPSHHRTAFQSPTSLGVEPLH
jgi:hypothetical protein